MGTETPPFKGEIDVRVQDFGRFDQEVTLFGGPYSNFHALSALLETNEDQPLICTGDIVAYCGDPAASVDLFMERTIPVIAGNCERQIAEDADDCGCGFGAGSACDLLAQSWYPHARTAMTDAHRAWMSALPDFGIFVQNDRRYAVIHGGATDISRFLWPSSETSDFEVEIAAVEAVTGPVDGVVAGHSGIPFHRWIGKHHWINAGAIGLPPHDGRTATRFARLLDGDVRFHRLDYDVDAAYQAMIAAGLTQGYHEALRTGYWPSEDILPQELRH